MGAFFIYQDKGSHLYPCPNNYNVSLFCLREDKKRRKRFKNGLGLVGDLFCLVFFFFFLDRVGVCDDKIAGSVLLYFIL